MRKFLIFIALILFSGFLFGEYISFDNKSSEPYSMRVISQSENEVVVEYDLKGLIANDVVIDGKKYTKFDIPGAVNYLKKGMPELPHINKNIIIGDMGRVNLKVISQKTETMQFAPPVPSKGNLYRNVDPNKVKYQFSKEYFVKSFPSKEIEISEPFIMRDFRGVNVAINPVIYDPVKGEYTIIKNIRFAISTTSLPGSNELKRESFVKKIDKDFDNIYRTSFLNYRDVEFRYPVVKEQGKMLIIAADNLYNTMIPFYLWKLQKGISCKMVKLSDIGGNNEDSIKSYIQNEYNTDSIAYILLVGDGSDIVPATGTYGAANGADCDPVYTYLSGGDYYPDAIIGRFSASSTTDISNMVDRSINYEMNPNPSGSWYHLAMGLGSTQGTPSDSERVAWLRDSLLTYNYTSVDLMIDGHQNATDISNALNEGRGFVYYCGHGSVTGWATPSYSNSNVQALSNTDMLPFVQSVACVVGDFNGNDCFAENWLKAGTPSAPTGGIDFYGSTINQSWVPPTVSQTEFVHLLVNEMNTTVGALYFNGSSKMIEQYGPTATDGVEMFQTWTIFGDPSIQVRTNTPTTMAVNHNSTILIGQNTFDVSTPGVVNALCGLYNPEDSTLVANGYTDASGNITLDLNPVPNYPGILILTVTAMNKIPVVDTINVISPSGPYVSYLSSIIDDASGNNNGQINPGESINLGVYLKNFGADSAHNVYAKISTSDTFVTITGDSVYFGDIDADDSLLGSSTYEFNVGQIPDGYS
ncbi:hypothetical protein J7J58_05015, partial [candidate division WOR-3 bacterium]|nr:hypothetical protein [candidate division WOR-3 bacterium]